MNAKGYLLYYHDLNLEINRQYSKVRSHNPFRFSQLSMTVQNPPSNAHSPFLVLPLWEVTLRSPHYCEQPSPPLIPCNR
jgi:hypothetical protein